MRIDGFTGVALLALFLSTPLLVRPQTAAPPEPPPPPDKQVGGFVPGQHREPGDPAQIERGKTLYGIHCGICHGTDLRGGDMGGPNLLRSQVALSDQNGELILPIIQGSRQTEGMPAIPIRPDDGLAVAAYVRSMLEMIGEQGTPPPTGLADPNVLVGNAKEGKAYFAAKCSSCHSVTGDLQGLSAKVPDAKDLQTSWVRGEVHTKNRGDDSPAALNPDAPNPRAPTVTVSLDSGDHIEGRLIHVDDFLVSARLADGTTRSFRRDGDTPKVDIHDPMKAHRDLLSQYTDRDIHDVTAYLTTLK